MARLKLGGAKRPKDKRAGTPEDVAADHGTDMASASKAEPAPSPRRKSGSQKRQRKACTVMLTPGERAALEADAAAAGLSLGAYLRACGLKGEAGPRARRSPTVDRQALAVARAELGRIGNNLNQMTRAVNMNWVPDMPELRATLAEVRQASAAILKALGYELHDS